MIKAQIKIGTCDVRSNVIAVDDRLDVVIADEGHIQHIMRQLHHLEAVALENHSLLLLEYLDGLVILVAVTVNVPLLSLLVLADCGLDELHNQLLS